MDGIRRPLSEPGDHPLTRRQFARIMGASVLVAAFPGCVESDVGRNSQWTGSDLPFASPTPAAADRLVLRDNLRVPMRDGIQLATDVWLPARDGVALPGPFPVILERTPYGRNRPSRSERSAAEPDRARSRGEVAALFVARGYAVVYQDCRGRYDSEGEYRKYIDDADDGFDCCTWILEQPWCDGQIGTMGLSYAAHTQGALASAGAPGIAAMFLDSGGFSDSYQGGIRQGGAFELKQATWAYRNAMAAPEVTADPELLAALEAVDIHDWFRRMPWARGRSPVSLAPAYEDYLFEQWEAGRFDEYWKRPGLWAQGFHDAWPDVPMVHMSSWFDPYPRTAAENYLGLSQIKSQPVRLILGPWTHGDRSLTWAGDVDFGPSAVIDGQYSTDFWELRLRWFDHWMRGVDNGVDREPAVRYFVMGGGTGARNPAGRLDHGGEWRSAQAWPVPGTRMVECRLTGEGQLHLGPRDPASGANQATPSSLSWTHDPSDPVPTIGGAITSGAPIMDGGAFDQVEGPDFFGSTQDGRPLAERDDVLAFQTDPLPEAVEVTGPIVAHLWVSSDAPDTDFTIKLIDVYPATDALPDGYAMILTDGILRLRYHESWEDPELVPPGEVRRITVEAFPTSNLFAAGHRIRLDIASANYPKFDINFNTGEPEGRATGSRSARNTLWLNDERPSHVVLPMVPR